ncbi:MAG: hypothetical protein ABI333_03165 [bacterium]
MKEAFGEVDRRLPEAAKLAYRKYLFSGPRLQLMLVAAAMVCVLLYFAFFHSCVFHS